MSVFSMPVVGGGAFPRPPYKYLKRHELVMSFATDVAVVRDLLPPGLVPRDPALGIVRLVNHEDSPFGDYTGAYLGVACTWEPTGVPLAYTFLGVKTDFASAVAGREVWGMPIKLGEAKLERSGDVVHAEVVIDGAVVLTADVEVGEPQPGSAAPAVKSAQGCFLKLVPAAGDNAVEIAELVEGGVDASAPAVGVSVRSVQLNVGDCPPSDPWNILPVEGEVRAKYSTGGALTLTTGSVLRTYESAELSAL